MSQRSLRHSRLLQLLPAVLLLFSPSPSSSCPTCPPPCSSCSARMRSEGLLGPVVTSAPPMRGWSWSTQWTQRPWSWSGGQQQQNGQMRPASSPPPPMPPVGEGQTADGAEQSNAIDKRQGMGGGPAGTAPAGPKGRLLVRFCSRHPEHEKCQRLFPHLAAQAQQNQQQQGEVEGTVDEQEQFPPPADGNLMEGMEGTQLAVPFSPSPPHNRPSFLRPLNSSPPSDAGMGGGFSADVPPETPAMPFGYLSAEARNAILKNCLSGTVDCRAQPFGMEQKRTMVVQHEMDFMRTVRPYQSAGQMAERRVDLVHQLKQKMLKVAGLGGHVNPVNDGTFEHDVLLTEGQSQGLLNALDSTPAPGKTQGYGHGRRFKRASLFLDQMEAQRWPMGQPIPYFFDPNIQEFEKEMVRQAHQMIQAQTCIRFEPAPTKPSADFLFYVKVATPTFCGLSYIGRVSPANPIYLSFQCQDPVGVAVHETMHALGANHEHLRTDRDDYIQVQWSNINPQFYDFFAIADPSKFTPYGIPYAYDSIMHYGSRTAALDAQKPTMVPQNNVQQNMALMGQRKRLSPRDVELLNAMYCKPGCEDQNVYCGVWALRNFCSTPPQMGWMQQNCRKSCKLC